MKLKPLRAHSDEMLRIDLLRFVASLAILWHHSQEFLVPVSQRMALHTQTRALALFVDMFFAISGFVISYVYGDRKMDRSGYGQFLLRRMGRLVPLHWLTYAINWLFWAAILYSGVVIAHAPDLSPQCSALNLALLHAVIPCGNGIFPNGVSWSISIEMCLYMVYPVLIWLFRSRLASLPVAIGLLALAMTALFLNEGIWDTVNPVVRGLFSFSVGINLFLLRDRLRHLPASSTTVILLLAATIIMMMSHIPHIIVLLAAYVTVAFAIAADMKGPPTGVVRSIAPLGQVTYSLYMWHPIFIAVFLNALGDKMLKLQGWGMGALVLICYVSIFITSYLSWALFEEPARHFINRLGRSRSERQKIAY